MQSQEGFSRTKINNLGMRGEDILPKQKNEYRILVLGDSFTKGIHVSDTKTYSYILQKTLKSKYSSNIQVINAARDGASPAYYIYPADFYNSFKPDSVIIQLRNGNFTDMLNNKEQFYVVQKNNTFKTVYNQSFLSDDTLSKIFLQKFKQLNFMLKFSVLRVGGRNLQKILTAKQTEENTAESEPVANQLPYSQNYDALIDWTLKTLKSKYPKVVILYLPDMDYSNLNKGSSNVETHLKIAAAQQGIDFINMRKSFTLYYQLHHQPAHGFNNTVPGKGHINEIGHALTAADLAGFFENKRAIK